MCDIIAGIVLYNPDREQLSKNVNALLNQVSEIVLIDNNSDNKEEIKNVYQNKGIKFISLDSNKGTSAAFNVLFLYAKEHQYKWCITMDQDSICDSCFVSKNKFLLNDECIAVVTPQIIYSCDKNKQNRQNGIVKDVEYAIASGSIVNVEKALFVGGYDENIFLDYADFEFCIRLRKAGWKIVLNSNTYIMHNLGKLNKKYIFGKEIFVTNHDAKRRFYYAKNMRYVQKKHPDVITKKDVKKRILLKGLVIVLFERKKTEKIHALFQGYNVEGD